MTIMATVMHRDGRARAIYCLFLSALLALMAALPATAQSAQLPQNDRYRIAVGDELAVTVFGQPDMSAKVRVRSDGTVSLAFLPSVSVADRTPVTVGAEIARRYVAGGYLKNPSVNVEVVEYVGKSVTILGAVNKPGLYPLDRPYSVAEIVARAGGAREGGANVVLLTSGAETQRIPLYDMSGAAARILQPGDGLFVPAEEQVFVYGAVTKPGAYSYRPQMTVRQALALAGGPTLAGSTHGLKITRGGVEVRIDLDDLIQPNDVLKIREKLF